MNIKNQFLFDVLNLNKKKNQKHENMKVNFFCPLWGSNSIPFEDFVIKAKKVGYEGVELPLPESKDLQKEYLKILQDYEMPYILQHYQTDKKNVKEYIHEFSGRLEGLVKENPVFINSQTGKDFFTFNDNCKIIERANKIEANSGVTIMHEIHRGKFSFACHLMPDYLKAFPEMKITADFSHWVNVSESMLEHQQENLEAVFPNVFHIHSRVGFMESAQVNDPRAPENKPFLERHMEWWDEIIRQRKESGDSEFTITTEFGPAPYMPLLPYTKQPVANQWDINVFMMDLLRERYRK